MRTLATLALLTTSLAAPLAHADTVRLLASARIAPGQAFTLADIADLDGPAAERLAETPIGKGETGAFEIAVDRVRQQLVVAGADLRGVDFEGAKTVVRPLRGAAVAQPADAFAARREDLTVVVEIPCDARRILPGQQQLERFGDAGEITLIQPLRLQRLLALHVGRVLLGEAVQFRELAVHFGRLLVQFRQFAVGIRNRPF